MTGAGAKQLNQELDAIAARAEAVVEAMRAFVQKADRVSYSELRAISEHLGKTRLEIDALAPLGIARRRIPSAGAELDALVKDSAEATERIMTAAEEILACDAVTLEAHAAYASERAMFILEACAFNDLAGQRVSKISDVLRVIEERTRRFASELGITDAPDCETEDERRNREALLNGPAVGDAGNNQQSIDDLFASL
jgi:chemotaxis protein CheZ